MVKPDPLRGQPSNIACLAGGSGGSNLISAACDGLSAKMTRAASTVPFGVSTCTGPLVFHPRNVVKGLASRTEPPSLLRCPSENACAQPYLRSCGGPPHLL